MDVAALSMSVDTTDVVKAANDLDRFSASSDKAAASSSKFSRSGSIAKMAQDYERAARAADQASSASAKAASAATSANAAVASGSMRAARALAEADAHVVAYRGHLAALPAAANQAVAGINRVTRAANDNANTFASNTGNIAAQFQDIGVTAAMGMNPLIIGLQQGTQLSAVFAQSGATMGATLAAAFRQIASATALMTIGIVAALAALIQFVDWGKLAQSAMLGLADILEDIAPYALGAAAALALIYAPAIITGIATLTKGFLSLAASMLACIPIPVLIVAGLTAIVAAANYWRDDLTRIFGVDIVAAAKSGINFIVGGFVGAYNAVRATWSELPAAIGDAAITAANQVIDATSGMINRVKQQLNELFVLRNKETGEERRLFNFSTGSNIDRIANPWAGTARRVNDVAAREIGAAQGRDWAGGFVDGARGLGRAGADMLRGWADGMGASDKADKADKADRAARMSEEARALEERNRATEQYIANLTEEVAKIGLSEEALRKYEVAQALARATTDAQREAIMKLSAARENALRIDRQQKEVNEAKKQIEAARANITGGVDIELQTMHLVGAEREREVLRIQRQIEMTDLLAKIKKAEADGNTALADTYRQLAETTDERFAKQMQAIDGREAIEAYTRATQSAREVTKGFFADWINGVREGGNLFKAFADSVVNSLNRIIDKLLDRTLNGFLDSLFANGPGFLGDLLGGGSSTSAIKAANKNALGGVYGTAQKFANGSAFANTIVNTPTLFRFAKGTKLGEMGEAGPEGIFPLGRTPDGKLGVHAIGGGGGGSKKAEINIKQDFHMEGVMTPNDVAAMVRQGSAAAVQEVRRNLDAYLREWDVDGAVV